nr:substrate-binding domain-containing protein [Oceanicoccus sp. KOV_DT_Chl]
MPTVCIDNTAAAIDAVTHLTAMGHTKVAYINGPSASPICKDRLNGYRQVMRKVGVTDTRRWVVEGDFSLASGRDAMMKLLSRGEMPTAVFAANDEMAIGAMAAIKAAGLTIPGIFLSLVLTILVFPSSLTRR